MFHESPALRGNEHQLLRYLQCPGTPGYTDVGRSDLGRAGGNLQAAEPSAVLSSLSDTWDYCSACAARGWTLSAKKLKTNQLYWPVSARTISTHF